MQKSLFRISSISTYLMFGFGLIATCGFLAFSAKTIQEYANTATVAAAVLNYTFVFISLRWRYQKVFELIEKCENLIEERKSTFCIRF